MRQHEIEMKERADRHIEAVNVSHERRALLRRVIGKYDWRERARMEREVEAIIAERRAA